VLRHILAELLEYPEVDIVVKGYTEYKRDNVLFRAHPNYHSTGLWYDWVHVSWETGEAKEGLKVTRHKAAKKSSYVSPYHAKWVPAKILAFLMFENHPKYEPDQVLAIIHSCQHKTSDEGKRDTRLTEEWTLEYPTMEQVNRVKGMKGHLTTTKGKPTGLAPKLYIVDVQTFGKRILVFEEQRGIFQSMGLHPLTGNKGTGVAGSSYVFNGKTYWAHPSPKVLLIRDRTKFWAGQFLSWVRKETRTYPDRTQLQKQAQGKKRKRKPS
jgi:hypothetical protein